jgi:hypothetical protein
MPKLVPFIINIVTFYGMHYDTDNACASILHLKHFKPHCRTLAVASLLHRGLNTRYNDYYTHCDDLQSL